MIDVEGTLVEFAGTRSSLEVSVAKSLLYYTLDSMTMLARANGIRHGFTCQAVANRCRFDIGYFSWGVPCALLEFPVIRDERVHFRLGKSRALFHYVARTEDLKGFGVRDFVELDVERICGFHLRELAGLDGDLRLFIGEHIDFECEFTRAEHYGKDPFRASTWT